MKLEFNLGMHLPEAFNKADKIIEWHKKHNTVCETYIEMRKSFLFNLQENDDYFLIMELD